MNILNLFYKQKILLVTLDAVSHAPPRTSTRKGKKYGCAGATNPQAKRLEKTESEHIYSLAEAKADL